MICAGASTPFSPATTTEITGEDPIANGSLARRCRGVVGLGVVVVGYLFNIVM
jgi:hypothetical protein